MAADVKIRWTVYAQGDSAHGFYRNLHQQATTFGLSTEVVERLRDDITTSYFSDAPDEAGGIGVHVQNWRELAAVLAAWHHCVIQVYVEFTDATVHAQISLHGEGPHSAYQFNRAALDTMLADAASAAVRTLQEALRTIR